MEKEKKATQTGRYERKFVISDVDIKEIEHIIRIHPAIFNEIHKLRNINNIYFDSIGLENYHDNIEGHSKRLKVRIRWYGEMFGLIKNPMLELKMKDGEIGRKTRFPLKEFFLDKDFSSRIFHEKILPKSELPLWLMEKLKLYKPSLLNSYKRRYFLSADGKNRLTVDSYLCYYEIKEENNNFLYKIEDKETIIIELKYDEDNDDKISEITQHLPFRLTKNSKYISGINLF